MRARRKMIVLTASLALVLLVLSRWSPAGRRSVTVDRPVVEQVKAPAVFRRYCSPCHGADGGGTLLGARLRGRDLDTAYVKRMIVGGNARMPPVRGISEPLLSDIAAYVHHLP